MEPDGCLKDWFVKWTQILSLLVSMIPVMKMAQNPYQSEPAELTWSLVSTLTGEVTVFLLILKATSHTPGGHALCLTIANLQLNWILGTTPQSTLILFALNF